MIDNEKDPINSHSVGYDDLTMAQKMNTTAYLYEPIIRANANCLVAVISGCRTYNDEAI
ncbi:hypothetical protein [Helicobacter pylori]|uniref:hypothetical protein n=1 Tax=Helicobacter pylori TaxID=210 RepID=UPI001CC784C9|nr:hypothetical protein [Helicobacter pylori]WRB70799.1 hypothetical protein KVE33_04815 [Helicobacter pylori]BDA06273.1 hypothetical protein OHP006_04650 [Helicobacter pylori]